jgi:hypothetical protein
MELEEIKRFGSNGLPPTTTSSVETLVPTMRKPFDVLAEGLTAPLSGGGGN